MFLSVPFMHSEARRGTWGVCAWVRIPGCRGQPIGRTSVSSGARHRSHIGGSTAAPCPARWHGDQTRSDLVRELQQHLRHWSSKNAGA